MRVIIERLRADVARIRTTPDDGIGALYADMIGHDPTDDGVAPDEARDILYDWVRECCYAEGIGCANVGL